jgi:hypothetical protein
MAKKRSMVQPPPIGPAVQLALLLQKIGNDRAYTVLSHEGNTWTLHFEGDHAPTVLLFDDDKPESV